MVLKTGKVFLFLSLVFVFFIFIVHTASAATYYVSKSGNDSTGDGSLGNPWLTMNKANITMTNGDIIHVGAGTYEENYGGGGYLQFLRRAQWIADGDVVVKSASTTSDGFSFRDIGGAGQTYSFTGFTFDGASNTLSTAIFNGVSNISFISSTFRNNASKILRDTASPSNISFVSSTFSSNTTTVRMFDFTTISGFSVTGSVFSFPSGFSSYFMNLTASATGTFNFYNNTFNLNLNEAIWNVAANTAIQFVSNTLTLTSTNYFLYVNTVATHTAPITIENNRFTLNDGMTGSVIRISTGTHPVIINNNYFTDSSSTDYNAAQSSLYNFILLVDQPAPIVTSNTIETMGDPDDNVTAIRIKSDGATVGAAQIKNNIIRTNHNNGYAIGVGTEGSTTGDNKINGTLFEGNTVYGPLYYHTTTTITNIGLHALFVGFNRNVIWRNNYINGGGYGIVSKGSNMDNSSGGIYNNIFVNTGAIDYLLLKGMSSTTVYNNIFYSDGTYTPYHGLMAAYTNDVGNYPSQNNTIKNNIFVAQDGVNFIYTADTTSTVGLISNNNLFWNGTASGLDFTLAGAATGLSGWQTGGYDAQGIAVDPKFISTSTSDFSLQATSSAIDAGSDVSIATDRIGNSRYGSYDIGAYEFQPSLVMGTDSISPTGDTRIYRNGNYRYTSATSSAATADFTITPSGGAFASSDLSEWLNLSSITWNTSGDYSKSWVASSSVATTTVFTIGDLVASTYYTIAVDGASSSTVLSDSNGRIVYTYSGGFSTHNFTVTPDATVPEGFSITLPNNNSSYTSNPTVSWSASTDTESGLSKYQLFLDDSLNVDNIASTSLSAVLVGSISCGSHSVYVKAVDSSSNSSTSGSVSFTMTGCAGSSAGTAVLVNIVPPILSTSPINIINIISSTTLEPFQPEEINPVNSGFVFKRFLTVGSTGEDVRQLQTILKNLGYFTYPTITGYFGSITRTAVVAFQKARGLKPYPGVVGPLTRAALSAGNSVAWSAPVTTESPETIFVPSTPVPLNKIIPGIPTEFTFSKLLRQGDIGLEVRYLQIFLKFMGESIYPEGKVTGIFGPLTKKALVRFQEKYFQEILAPWHLEKGTGVVGRNTLKKINSIMVGE